MDNPPETKLEKKGRGACVGLSDRSGHFGQKEGEGRSVNLRFPGFIRDQRERTLPRAGPYEPKCRTTLRPYGLYALWGVGFSETMGQTHLLVNGGIDGAMI